MFIFIGVRKRKYWLLVALIYLLHLPIIFIIELVKSNGGLEAVVMWVSKNLASKGHDVTLPLGRGRRAQILPANDQIDSRSRIIDDAGEVVG